MIKKHWFTFLIFLSIFFLFIRLSSSFSFSLPVISCYNRFALSLLFLAATFFCLAVRWRYTLKFMKMSVTIPESIVAVGLPIFAKYIPGKFMMILGKTGYLSKSRGFSMGQLSLAAFIDQFLAIVVGISFGGFFLIQMDSFLYGILPGLAILTVLLLFLFHPTLIQIPLRWINRITGRNIQLTKPSASLILKLVPIHVVFWTSASLGFYFLVSSVDISINSFLTGLAFPFAVCAGIVALFAPGGLGVRESILLGAFSITGVDNETALPIVFLSRLWFMAGELLVFLLALFLKGKTSPTHLLPEDNRTYIHEPEEVPPR